MLLRLCDCAKTFLKMGHIKRVPVGPDGRSTTMRRNQKSGKSTEQTRSPHRPFASLCVQQFSRVGAQNIDALGRFAVELRHAIRLAAIS
jgi:hypothetical protein